MLSEPPELREILLREGKDAQLQHIAGWRQHAIEHCDAYLGLIADENTKGLYGADPSRMVLLQQAQRPIQKALFERTARGEMRWCGTLFPTSANAQEAGMSLSDYEDFVFGAGLLNLDDPAEGWRKVEVEQRHIADFLSQHDEIHIVAPDTDLTYRVKGRKWINANGKVNFPDGEVFTGPLEDSAEGTVRFSFPALYVGREAEDVRLTFRQGKAVEASAARGQDFLLAMLNQDEGARYLGEVAFGLNYGIQRFSHHTLFDEKIGGTMHMALGNSYPQTGGMNKSALHWDMVCDLRQGGQVYADGQLCYADGKFLV